MENVIDFIKRRLLISTHLMRTAVGFLISIYEFELELTKGCRMILIVIKAEYPCLLATSLLYLLSWWRG